MFSPEKAAQIAAFFAQKERGTINIMKLVKLMYLADREAMARYATPISFDRMVSMNNGPVLSQTLNLINGDVQQSAAAVWDAWMTDREGHKISAKKGASVEELDQLSDADLEVLADTWGRFGRMNQFDLSAYTHKNCPEWRFPEGSAMPISEMDVFKALGKSTEEAFILSERLKEESELDRVFARL